MWMLAWAVLNGLELAPTLPDAFADDLRRYGFTSRSLWDDAVELPDELKRAVGEYADRQVDAVQQTIFPLHDLSQPSFVASSSKSFTTRSTLGSEGRSAFAWSPNSRGLCTYAVSHPQPRAAWRSE